MRREATRSRSGRIGALGRRIAWEDFKRGGYRQIWARAMAHHLAAGVKDDIGKKKERLIRKRSVYGKHVVEDLMRDNYEMLWQIRRMWEIRYDYSGNGQRERERGGGDTDASRDRAIRHQFKKKAAAEAAYE